MRAARAIAALALSAVAAAVAAVAVLVPGRAAAKVDEVKPMAAAKADAALPALAVPASWKPMAEAARAMEEKLTAAKLRNVTTAAWGDAPRGCYAIQLSAMEPAVRLADVAAGLRQGFGLPPEKPVTGSAPAAANGAPPANAGSADLQFNVAPPLTGVMRARLRDDGAATRLSAAACFYHPRYPEQCRRHCERALASLEAP